MLIDNYAFDLNPIKEDLFSKNLIKIGICADNKCNLQNIQSKVD